jgi:hypothetical protein
MTPSAPLAVAALASLALAGCVTVTAPDGSPVSEGGPCNAQRAQVLVGQTASAASGARALSLTGARQLRWGPPEAIWTMDLRGDRVNVRYDTAMTITGITCG